MVSPFRSGWAIRVTYILVFRHCCVCCMFCLDLSTTKFYVSIESSYVRFRLAHVKFFVNIYFNQSDKLSPLETHSSTHCHSTLCHVNHGTSPPFNTEFLQFQILQIPSNAGFNATVLQWGLRLHVSHKWGWLSSWFLYLILDGRIYSASLFFNTMFLKPYREVLRLCISQSI